MADKFPNFSLGIIQVRGVFFYDLENEEENEFLAAVDLEALNVTDKVDKVTVNKAAVLNENSFQFNGKNYLQTHGTVMGTNLKMAVS